MKKAFLIAALLCGSAAFADVMNYQMFHWKVDENSYAADSATAARMYAVVGEGENERRVNLGGLTDQGPVAGVVNESNFLVLGSDSDKASASYYFELLGSNGERLSISDSYTYHQLMNSGAFDITYAGLMDAPIVHSAPFTAYTFVPEPTSGLLMLLGLAGLALKRKRA